MGHAGGMLDQGVGVAQRDSNGGDLQAVQQLLACRKAAQALDVVLQLEADHAAVHAVFHLPAGQLMLGMALQPGIVHRLHIGICLQIAGDLHGAGAVLLHPQGQGLHAPQHQIAVEGRGRAAVDLGHAVGADQPDVVRPADDHAAQGVAVAVDVLGDAVQHDIGAQLQHMLHRGRGERAVHHHPDVGSGDVLDGPDVRHLHHGIVGGLEIDHLGVGPDGGLHGLQVAGVHAGDLHAHAGQIGGGHVVGAAVDRRVKDGVVAGVQERSHHGTHSAHAGGRRHRVLAALHGGAFQLKGPGGGVAAAGVDESGDLVGKLCGALFHRFKAEGGRLINRSGKGAVSLVRLLSRVDDQGLKIYIFQINLAHMNPPQWLHRAYQIADIRCLGYLKQYSCLRRSVNLQIS